MSSKSIRVHFGLRHFSRILNLRLSRVRLVAWVRRGISTLSVSAPRFWFFFSFAGGCSMICVQMNRPLVTLSRVSLISALTTPEPNYDSPFTFRRSLFNATQYSSMFSIVYQQIGRRRGGHWRREKRGRME